MGGRTTTNYASRTGARILTYSGRRMAGMRLRVGVLFGGRSSEHEVSLQSARAVMDALAQAGHEVIPIGISKTGRFLVGGDPLRALSSGDFTGEQSATMLPEPGGTGLVRTNDGAASLDVLFPVLARDLWRGWHRSGALRAGGRAVRGRRCARVGAGHGQGGAEDAVARHGAARGGLPERAAPRARARRRWGARPHRRRLWLPVLHETRESRLQRGCAQGSRSR